MVQFAMEDAGEDDIDGEVSVRCTYCTCAYTVYIIHILYVLYLCKTSSPMYNIY